MLGGLAASLTPYKQYTMLPNTVNRGVTHMNAKIYLLMLAAFASINVAAGGQVPKAVVKAAVNSNLEFIDSTFENASPLWYETDTDGVIGIHLNYDHERSSPNRAAGHIHFRVQAKAGAK